MAAPPITQATQFKLPPRVSEVFENLTKDGEREFIRELLEAMEAADATDDFRPLLDVVEAWYRTLVVLRDPGFDANYRWSLEHPPKPGDGRSISELRKELGR